jgi:CheY-like chemotaxis protein
MSFRELTMSQTTVLLVDSDAKTRTTLAAQLEPLGCQILQAGDGVSALRTLGERQVQLVVTELYVPVGDSDCLVDAIRANDGNRATRIIALTARSQASDREWALRAGADAYLIKPTRAQRLRYVVGRLSAARPPAHAGAAGSVSITRRDSLEQAFHDIEVGALGDAVSIIFGRGWWEKLPTAQRTAFRRRAKGARVSLRSDSKLKNHYVEVRGRSHGELGLSSERPESPYRR